MQAFIAPVGFSSAAQELNIHKVFSDYVYSNPTAKFIVSIGNVASTLFIFSTGKSAYVGQEVLGVMVYNSITQSNTTFVWNVGSIKRFIIYLDTAATSTANPPTGSVWLYIGKNVTSVIATWVNTLKYVHAESLNSITSIGGSFAYCSGLIGIANIPNQVTTIGNTTFWNCNKLTDINIPSQIVSIGLSALSLTAFTTITVDAGNQFYVCESGILYDKAKTIILIAKRNITGMLTIPESVTSISAYAFYGCSGLTGSIIIPNGVSIIEPFTFNGCTGFEGTLNISDSVTSIGDSAFYNCTKLTGNLTIPIGTTYIVSDRKPHLLRVS